MTPVQYFDQHVNLEKRAFYLASIILVVVALSIHIEAREQMSEGQRLKARSLEYAVKHQTQAVADLVAVRQSDRGQILNKVGLVFAGFGLVCFVVALVRRESGWYLIPVVLLLFDVAEQVIL